VCVLGAGHHLGGGGVVETVIVAVTLVFSVTILGFTWTRRAELLAGGAG
jgi:hypothetical protein